MTIDAKTVAELRKRSGLPMMKCKKALMEAGGDIEVAANNLRKEGHKTVDKLKGREMKDGLVFTHRAEDGGVCAVAILCETDFVARSADFLAFGETLAETLVSSAPADRGNGDALNDVALPDGRSVKEHLDELVGSKIRENMKVGEFARFRPEQGYVASYEHHNGKIATLVELTGEDLASRGVVQELGRDLGMQIAFHAQLESLDTDGIDPEWIEKERQVFEAQSQDLPEDKREQIIEGKLKKRLKDVVLIDQPFIKNEKESVRSHVEAVAKQAETAIAISRFARIAAGA